MKKKMRGASKLGLKCLAAVLGSLVLLGSSLLITEHREKMEAYALEQEGVADFVSRLYTEVLNRTPDEAGLNAWCDGLLDGTLTGAEVAKGFIMSNEFLGKDMEHEEFVQIIEVPSCDLYFRSGKAAEAVEGLLCHQPHSHHGL